MASPKELLPNLLCAAEYFVTKSGNKKIAVGLEYTNGLFVPVVKIYAPKEPYKCVTLDTASWGLVREQLVRAMKYTAAGDALDDDDRDFQEEEELVNNFTVIADGVTIKFGKVRNVPGVVVTQKYEASASTPVMDSEGQDCNPSSEESPRKKTKLEKERYISMQRASIEGLYTLRRVIDYTLEEIRVFNSCVLSDYLESLIDNLQARTRRDSRLKELGEFQKHFTQSSDSIEEEVMASLMVGGQFRYMLKRAAREITGYASTIIFHMLKKNSCIESPQIQSVEPQQAKDRAENPPEVLDLSTDGRRDREV